MPKRRKTRQEKIILQLKRELAKRKQVSASTSIKSKLSQEAISKQPQTEPKRTEISKKSGASIFFYDPGLVRKDLFKTLILTLAALALEFMLYLKLR